MHKNKTILAGKVTKIEESHKLPDSIFYRFTVEVPRMSGAIDTLPFMVSNKLLHNNPINVGDLVLAHGEIRTLNRMEDGKSKLLVFNYVHEIEPLTAEAYLSIADKNIAKVEGYVVKEPVFRETGNGRRIADLVVAHNRSYKKESYIPTIAWGIDAAFAKNLQIGEQLAINGRIQSRTYQAKDSTEKTVYELSVNSMSLFAVEV